METPVTTEISHLESLVIETLAALKDPEAQTPPSADTTTRERFYEFVAVVLGNLFARTPIATNLYDRATLLRVVEGMEDGESATLAKRADDWMRLEGIIRQMEGQRSYFLPLPTLAVLSITTAHGALGDIFAQILKRYLEVKPNDNVRRLTRLLAAEVIIRLGKA